MNDEFELDFDDDPENEKNIYNRRKEHREYEKGIHYSKEVIRDLSKSTSRKNLASNDNLHTSTSMIKAHNAITYTQKYNHDRKNKGERNLNSKYYFIFFNNNNYYQVKDFLTERSLKIFKPNHFIFINKEIEGVKHVYFMFVNSDKKLIKAVMKKDYIKYDRDFKKIDNIKLETKTKYLKIYFYSTLTFY
jgi:hypothetical protein